MKVIRFLIADLAATILSSDAVTANQAKYEIGRLGEIFTHLHQLILSSTADSLEVACSIHHEHRYHETTDLTEIGSL
jgi:hypothetical protein